MGYIRNAVLIDAPVNEVFIRTNNVRTWPSLFTEYASSEVLEEMENIVTFRLTTHPDEDGHVWSWIAQRETNLERYSTYSKRHPSSGPFEHMVIRWWYNSIGETQTVMTWEQEFRMKVGVAVTEQQATQYLQKQSSIQQRVIKERIEQSLATKTEIDEIYRGLIIGRYEPGSENAIADAFRRSDATELPKLLHVKSRHVWVLGDIYVHFVEGQATLPSILKERAEQPLFKEIKAELDTYVHPLSPELYPGVAKEIYRWTPNNAD